MKISSKIMVFLIIVCFIFCVSLVSASEISDGAVATADDYQSDMILNQENGLESISNDDSYEENLNAKSDDANVLNQDGDSGTFTDFYDDLAAGGNEFNLTRNYVHSENDSSNAGFFKVRNLVINGNNHVLDGSGAKFRFTFNLNYDDESTASPNIVINDLTITNFKSSPLFFKDFDVTLNNVNFTDCYSDSSALLEAAGFFSFIAVNNCSFHSNSASGYIKLPSCNLTIKDSYFSGRDCINSAVILNRGNLFVENSTFENFNTVQGSAIQYKGDRFEIRNSRFLNSRANTSGGAILAKFFPLYNVLPDQSYEFYINGNFIIENCQFFNVSCSNDGGAIHIDLDSGSNRVKQTLIVKDSNFTDSISRFGGAISILGGILNVSDSRFINNSAGFEGGAIYSSWSDLNIEGSVFDKNNAAKNAGALYFDKGKLMVNGSSFTNNGVAEVTNTSANAIYAHDVDALLSNSVFDNGGVGVYADFAANSKLSNVTKNDDAFLMDNHDYTVSIETPGVKLNLTGNGISVDTLPSRFDTRDWGWTTPGKIQGVDNFDCWAFATTAALETALLKSTGVAYNISENYIQKLQLKYYPMGDIRNSLTGFSYSGLGYALSWIGTLPVDSVYDERGMILDTDLNDPRIHVQDAMIIYTGLENTVEMLKWAIIKYGAVAVQQHVENYTSISSEGDDFALQDHGTHFLTLIGWDDNYTPDAQPTEDDPYPKFAWITKDSLSGFGYLKYKNFADVDYYAIAPQRAAVAYIFENANDYHVNYQTDLTGLAGFNGSYTMYSNQFTSKYSELIGAVGTYFNESGIDYSFDVYVNGKKVHTQAGVSEFAGFRTIVLNKYIPVKAGDVFKVVFKSNSVPYQAWSRVHYLNGTSLVSKDNQTWTDFAASGKTVCLKVYTLKPDENSFSALAELITNSGEEVNITHDYIFNESCDSYILLNDYELYQSLRILVENGKLVINGNNHVIDGAGIGAGLYFLTSKADVVINDLTFRNFNKTALYSKGNIKLNNVNFTGSVSSVEPILSFAGSNATLNHCNVHSNGAYILIYETNSRLLINNSAITGTDSDQMGIVANRGQMLIHNSVVDNFTCMNYTMIDFKGDRFELVNSNFTNSRTSLSGGAILAKYFPIKMGKSVVDTDAFLIRDCLFANLTCGNDGGAIHIDMDSASQYTRKTMNVINSNFTDCSSRFGGAISLLGGNLNITGSRFENNTASFAGGAIYSSWANVTISNSSFKNNRADMNAGVIYFDKGRLTITGSNLTDNAALGNRSDYANGIYAHDVVLNIIHSDFDNGGVGVYADFADDSKIINVTKNDDIFLIDNHNYILSVETPSIKLNFTNDQIIVDKLPSRFDARDWGWTTPGKIQGDNDDCWAFATVASIETALKKATGVGYNLSANYVQKMQLKYYPVGDKRISLTGFAHSGLGYALSWFGVLAMDSEYDDRGMIVDADMDTERIHVQDAMFIYTGMNDTVDLIKRAIMKYGAVTVQLYVYEPEEEIPTEGDDIAIMDHSTHFVSLIGWNDNDTEYENGIWYAKDSLIGFDSHELINFSQIDYYAIAPQRVAIAYIFENDIDYHVNYQTDLTSLAGFDGNYTTYSNEFTSKYDELIGAVGTYFNESGIDYSFDVFVNGVKVHTQAGVSEFAGFRTIVLNKYIPVKTGDVFKVVFKSNSVPYQAWSRVHYLNGTSLASADGNSWVDFASLNKTVCLKVYTVADDTKIVENRDISVDYDGGSYFTVKVVTADGRPVGAGESVKFTINGKTYTVETDNDGIARINISEAPGKYTITSSYNGVSYKNTVTVRHVVTVSKVNVKNTDKKMLLKATVKINGKVVKGKTVKFTFKGKTYTAKTNAKGVASVKVKKSVVKKLSKKSYPVNVAYLKDSVKGTVKVKQVLKASKAKVKKSSKKLKLKASLKINGKAAKKKTIKFKFKGKTYKAKTNKKGVAKVTIKKKVIKKLKKGKTYKVKVSYGKAYVKTTVKVKK